jgi:hypothetical protein
MTLGKTIFAVTALISAWLPGHFASAQTQPAPMGPAPEGFSSARPGPGEEKSETWTDTKMRQARQLPLPEVDPDAVRDAARTMGQLGARIMGVQAPGSTDPYVPPDP